MTLRTNVVEWGDKTLDKVPATIEKQLIISKEEHQRLSLQEVAKTELELSHFF